MNKISKSVAKGEPGYIDAMKKGELLIAIILISVSAAIFVLGLILNKWQKGNIFTIISMLFVIPMARFAATYIMLFPFKSVSREEYDKVISNAKSGSIVYADVVLTSTKNAMSLDFLVITGDKVLGVIGRKKENALDIRNYLQDICNRRTLDYKVTIAEDYTKFYTLLKGSDCAADIKFDSDEEKESFDAARAELCTVIESLIP